MRREDEPSRVPDLAEAGAAGVRPWRGEAGPLRAAAKAAGLRFHRVALPGAADKAAFLAAAAVGLRLPRHFGRNWDALADCLGDADWLDVRGAVVLIEGAARFRRAHPDDWEIAARVFGEAAAWWSARGRPLWIFHA